MKCFERLVKGHITAVLPPALDRLQFAYGPNRSTEDTVSHALHLSMEHLEKRNSHVRMLFVDFSSAFNTIIPQHLVSKLGPLGLSPPVCNWILVFLTDRPQSVHMGTNTSDTIWLSTGSLQGCVLSPLLLTLMTHDCCARSATNHIIKYTADTRMVSLIQDNMELAYREEVKHLMDWCTGNNLFLVFLLLTAFRSNPVFSFYVFIFCCYVGQWQRTQSTVIKTIETIADAFQVSLSHSLLWDFHQRQPSVE